LALVALVVFLSATTPGRGAALTFFQSLRIAKPQPVSVNVPGFSGPAATRRLQDAVSGMIADSVRVMLDEPDQSVPNPAAASHLAGFGARLPEARRDPPTLIVLGAHAVAMSVNPSQLRTIFAESGRPNVDLPPSLNGASVTIKTPPAIRAQYGHCPVPVANTLQNQIQGPPPPSTDNGDCVVLVESPPASADVPSGLDMTQLVTIGLELSGMSPNQTQAFQRLFDWPSALSLSMPRFMRSYDSVSVDGVRGMLLNTAGRRGPTYELIWTKNAIVYSLTGYGSSADAVPLANSTN
jgi:hypothetical protein